MIPFAVTNLFKAANRVFQGCDFTFLAGEDFCHEEGLGKESFDASCAVHDQPIFFTQFIDSQNCDDILQFAVALQGCLNAAGDRVVAITNVLRIENPAVGCQWIDGGVNTLFRYRSFQVNERVQLRKSRGRRGIRRIIRGHINRLHRSNGTLAG